jgi:hypothetical protein
VLALFSADGYVSFFPLPEVDIFQFEKVIYRGIKSSQATSRVLAHLFIDIIGDKVR